MFVELGMMGLEHREIGQKTVPLAYSADDNFFDYITPTNKTAADTL